MNDTADTANVIIRPPIAWALAVLAGLALQWIIGMPFMPASVPVGWIGLGMCLGLVGLAIAFNSLWLLGALVPFHSLRRGGARGSLSREQVRRRLSPLPRAGAALAVAPGTGCFPSWRSLVHAGKVSLEIARRRPAGLFLFAAA
jgi:hypothetical protein